MRRSDDSLAALLLVDRLVDRDVAPLTANEFWSVVKVVTRPADLLRAVDDDDAATEALLAAQPVDNGRVRRLIDSGRALAFELEDLDSAGIIPITPFDDAYPSALVDRLGAGAPPVLYTAGPPELLTRPAMTIVGSRNGSGAAADVAMAAGRLFASRNIVVVSGGARGVGARATSAALEAGGSTVDVLADSLMRTVRSREARRTLARGFTCFTTPHKPTASFSTVNALGRNKILHSLCRLSFVVTADDGTGSTWLGAIEALERQYATVAVWRGAGAGSGNERLIDAGAIPVDDPADLLPLAQGDPSSP